ncbi:MAG: assimilatory sulfite reductase (NADPH) flavoprotein subunit [Paludibacter sp.]|nr:assimilatory sulfite reductase (NADPH) flavoprotein subunit [Paludibacter sp.]
MTNNNLLPLSTEQIKLLTELAASLSAAQINWVSGYFAGLSAQDINVQNNSVSINTPLLQNEIVTSETEKSLTILYGSRTGNGEGIAKQAQKNAAALGIDAKLKSMETYKNNDLKNETNLLLIVSTHGEGEPPFQAKTFYDFLFSKRAPKLEELNFSVLALGDSSYLKFCQTGIDIDNRLEELGAKRIAKRVECDVNFRDSALKWIKDSLKVLNSNSANSQQTKLIYTKSETDSIYGKENPFQAQVLEKTFLHGRDSNRQTLHVELSLENSGITYEPGDSLGVFATNPPELVESLIKTVNLSPTDKVISEQGDITLSDTLFKNYELTHITPDVLNRYAKLTDNNKIKEILQSPDSVKDFIYGKDLVDLFTQFPEELSPDQFVSILRPVQPRLYSISSSPQTYPNEVHLTVGVVKYKNGDRNKTGLCSVFLSDRTEENETAPVFIEKNHNFRLPQNHETPIIMVGAGTGVAPYRAFLQHREQVEKRGKSWLIFGNRHSESEFLYQLEWQRHLRESSLTRMDVAFSRDNSEKVYVQNHIKEQGKLLFDWLENGAHFYVCGDMKRMAHDVHNTLVNVVSKHGGLKQQAAEEYVFNLQQQHRYQTDVY